MESLDQQMLNAATQKDLDTVKKLVAQGADINYMDKWSNTAIFSAAWEGDINALDVFYDLGATLDLGEINLLCNAAFNAQVASVKWLIDKGADVNYVLSTGENALHYTISSTGRMTERTEIVTILVNAGTDISKKTIPRKETLCFMRDAFLKGETPLHRAAAYGDENMVGVLLAAGADRTVQDANGDTPLSWASWHLRPSNVLDLLIYR